MHVHVRLAAYLENQLPTGSSISAVTRLRMSSHVIVCKFVNDTTSEVISFALLFASSCYYY